MAKKGRRLDVVMTDRGLAPSRSRAQALILAGRVRVEGSAQVKAGSQVAEDAIIEVIQPDHPWVGRGALKLIAALDAFDICPDGLRCLDVGASTGGFSEVMLDRGAESVIAVDVGHNQLDWKLRSDDRVIVMEGVNARHLGPEDLPFTVRLVTIDVSFISLRLVVPAVLPWLEPGGHLVCLVKPQFEAGREQVGKGGIIRDEGVRRAAIDATVEALTDLGLEPMGRIDSPIRGQKGNLEELVAFHRTAS